MQFLNQKQSFYALGLVIVGVSLIAAAVVRKGLRGDFNISAESKIIDIQHNIYKGVSNGFDVIIEQEVWGSNMCDCEVETMEILLHPQDASSNVGIGALSTNPAKGTWDVIAFSNYPDKTNGCNAYFYNVGEKPVWHPDPADKDRLAPFPQDMMFRVQSTLAMAMADVHRPDHLVDTLDKMQEREKAAAKK
jgi:hypothetical protein